MEVKLGTKVTTFPSKDLQELESCNDILNNADALRNRINEKGYLLVRNFHDCKDVLKARNSVLEYINKQDSHILDTKNHQLEDAVLNPNCGLGCVPIMEGKNDITHCKNLLRILEGAHAAGSCERITCFRVKQQPGVIYEVSEYRTLKEKKSFDIKKSMFNFFKKLFGEDALTFDFKWLRAMHYSGFTGAHIDRVYMSRGSERLLTLWTPLGDIPANMGVLAVSEGSHKTQHGFEKFHKTYGECDLEKENIGGTGWFTENPDEISRIGGEWKTTSFNAGDVIIFNIRLIHMSTANLTNQLRLSCDTRWQPRSQKADPRYVGEIRSRSPTYGVYGSKTDEIQTVSTLKKQWGFAV